MQSILRGLRSGVALFRTHPASAIAAVAALGLGIGASTTMFSIVHGGTRALPFDEAGSIVAVQRLAARSGAVPSSTVRDFQAWSGRVRSFAAIGAFQTRSLNLGGEGESPERVSTAVVTTGSFELLRVQPALGRRFVDADAGADVAILSHGLWSRRYSADPAIIGKTIRLDGAPRIVVGVMPPRFGFPIDAALWTPLPEQAAAWSAETIQVFGRLAPGAAADTARAELLTIAQAAAGTDEARAAIALDVVRFTEIETPREARWGLYLLLLAASSVLVIACVNVACLFIARAVARARDVAVRLALGAERRQILIEQIAESCVLSGVAAMAGVAMAWSGTRAFRAATVDILNAFWMDFRVDTAVIAYACGLAVVAAAAAAGLPALRASRTDVVSMLRDGSGATSLRIGRLSRGLLAAQIALACALLAMTTTLGRAAVNLHQRPWPFNPDTVLTAQVSIPQAQMDDAASRARLLDRLDEELRALPGARSAALASVLPGRGAGNWTFSFDGPATDPVTMPFTGLTLVSPSYFETLGARVSRGRGIEARDRDGAPIAAVVNDSFVARYSADRDPIGRQLFVGRRELTIVGVVPDLMSGDVDSPRQDGVYVSIHQMRPYAVRVMAAGPVDPAALLRPLRAAIDRVDPDLPVFEAATARAAALQDKQILDVISSLFGIFGAGALVLIAIGLYSVTAFSIAQRRRELAIRVAVGATRRDLLRLVSSQGARQLAAGVIAGAALAVALMRAFSAALEFVSGAEGAIVVGVIASVLLTAVLAMAGPVLQAMRTDAAAALRE